MTFRDCSRETLATLVPELLLCGHLIDRSGMPHTIAAFGREGMTAVAIEEWQLASPVYTGRMRRALGITGDGVDAIFKCFQLDIGAPPQFMDFRFQVDDHDHGQFWLDSCGALADVEPLGDAFVVAMCHDIEDPTFDATALATNPHVQVRPIHRPPRRPADRKPVCAWTVTIDPGHTPPLPAPGSELLAGSAAAALKLSPIAADDPGVADYSGPLLSDLRFQDFSHSALVRIAEEVSLQHHLLTLGFCHALRTRLEDDAAVALARKQFAGIAGLTSRRLRAALGLGDDLAGLAAVLEVHPALNPRQYVGAEVGLADSAVTLHLPASSAAMADRAWPSMLDSEHLEPLDIMVRGVNPQFVSRVATADDNGLTLEIVAADAPFPQAPEVALTQISTGAAFTFTDRGIPLPLVF